MPVTSLEGPMGNGKTLTGVALIYTDYLNKEIKRIIFSLLKDGADFREIAEVLRRKFALDEQKAASYCQEVVWLINQGVEEIQPLRVVSNMHLNFPHDYFDREYLVEHLEDEVLTGCALLWDEPYRDVESRAGTSRVNRLYSSFAMEIRKRDIDGYICVQHIDMIDKRLRRAVEVRGTCRYQKEKPCMKCLGTGFVMPKKKNGNTEEKLTCDRCLGYGETGWATTRFVDFRSGAKPKKIRIFGPAFFSLYWTKERIPYSIRQKMLPEDEMTTSRKPKTNIEIAKVLPTGVSA